MAARARGGLITAQRATSEEAVMAAIVEQDPPITSETQATAPFDDPVTVRLARLERTVEEGNRVIRRTSNGFALFAVIALLLAMGNLIAVATKLDGTGGVTRAAGPMMRTSPAAVAPSTAAALPTHVTASLKEYSVGLSSTVAKAGAVRFDVRNDGTMTHEFVVLRTAKAAAGLGTPSGRADEAGNVGETGDMRPGAAKTLHLRLPAGHYALICNLPGHYMAGQHVDFTVR
jgi:uncharacterized cupredoxin-like copper-binding protein